MFNKNSMEYFMSVRASEAATATVKCPSSEVQINCSVTEEYAKIISVEFFPDKLIHSKNKA
jgi:hypothetical protein